MQLEIHAAVKELVSEDPQLVEWGKDSGSEVAGAKRRQLSRLRYSSA